MLVVYLIYTGDRREHMYKGSIKMRDYRIYALNTETGKNNIWLVWLSENELEDQIAALKSAGYDSITVYKLG